MTFSDEEIPKICDIIETYIFNIRGDPYSSESRKKKYINKLRLLRDDIEQGGLANFAYSQVYEIRNDFFNSKVRRLIKRFSQ